MVKDIMEVVNHEVYEDIFTQLNKIGVCNGRVLMKRTEVKEVEEYYCDFLRLRMYR